jgi:uncharacterized Zn-finger protein
MQVENIPFYIKSVMVKMFKYRYCDKQFKYRGSLTNHLRSHEGKECKLCNSTFKRRSYLLKHLKLHSNKQQNLRNLLRA